MASIRMDHYLFSEGQLVGTNTCLVKDKVLQNWRESIDTIFFWVNPIHLSKCIATICCSGRARVRIIALSIVEQIQI